MADWPRTINPLTATLPDWEGPLRQRTHSGYVQTRAPVRAGVVWREDYPLLKHGRLDDEALIAVMEDALFSGRIYDAVHPSIPGSGIAPNGLGTGGVTVNGGSQTGDTINVTGFPTGQARAVAAGDWIGIAGINKRFKVRADAASDGSGNCSIPIMPSIWPGEEPVNGAAVTLTGLKFRVSVQSSSINRDTRQAMYWAGVYIVFEERL